MRLLRSVLLLSSVCSVVFPQPAKRPSPNAPAIRQLPPLALTAGDLPRFAHPQAALSLGVRLESLLASPMLRTLMNQALPANQATRAWDAVRKIEAIHVSVAMGARKQPEFLVLIQGELPADVLQMAANAKQQLYRVNERTLLAGDPLAVQAAYQRLRQGRATTAAANDAPPADFWLEADLTHLPAEAGLPPLLSDIRKVRLHLDLHEGMHIRARAETSNPEAAARLLAEFNKKMAETPGAAEAFGKQFDVQVDGSTLRLDASATAEEMAAATEKFTQALQQRTNAKAAPARNDAPPRRPVIHGQD